MIICLLFFLYIGWSKKVILIDMDIYSVYLKKKLNVKIVSVKNIIIY